MNQKKNKNKKKKKNQDGRVNSNKGDKGIDSSILSCSITELSNLFSKDSRFVTFPIPF